MDILPFSVINVISLFLSGCLYLFFILVLHLVCNCLRRDSCLVIACPRLRSVASAETLRHKISASNRQGWHWKGWPTDANFFICIRAENCFNMQKVVQIDTNFESQLEPMGPWEAQLDTSMCRTKLGEFFPMPAGNGK